MTFRLLSPIRRSALKHMWLVSVCFSLVIGGCANCEDEGLEQSAWLRSRSYQFSKTDLYGTATTVEVQRTFQGLFGTQVAKNLVVSVDRDASTIRFEYQDVTGTVQSRVYGFSQR